MIANTPAPPYYAVIFTSVKSDENDDYNHMSHQLTELVKNQPGFLGFESARNTIGITVSYWKNLEAINNWKHHTLHAVAQKKGKAQWYKQYRIRICKVEKDYGFF